LGVNFRSGFQPLNTRKILADKKNTCLLFFYVLQHISKSLKSVRSRWDTFLVKRANKSNAVVNRASINVIYYLYLHTFRLSFKPSSVHKSTFLSVRCSNRFTLIMSNIKNTSECHTVRRNARRGARGVVISIVNIDIQSVKW